MRQSLIELILGAKGEKMIQECGEQAVSFDNVLQGMDIYGKIVGMIHCIAPYQSFDGASGESKKGVEHLTQVFFSKGYIHIADGFMLGYEDGLREERFFKANALATIAFMMTGFYNTISEENLYRIGFDKIEDKPKYFVFKIPPQFAVKNISESRGWQCFQKALEIMQLQSEDMVVIGEKNESQS